MKKMILIVGLMAVCWELLGQNRLFDLDPEIITLDFNRPKDIYYSEINQKKLEDYYYSQYGNIAYNVQQAANRALSENNPQTNNIVQSGGIRFEYDNAAISGSDPNAARRRKALQEAQKAQRDAQHQAWLAQRELEKEKARKEEELRRIKEEMERQRKYNEAVRRGYQQTSAKYARAHGAVEYRATEGFERMAYTRPRGTERIQSGYVPSGRNASSQEVLAYLSRRSASRRAIHLIEGNETSNAGTSMAYQNYYEWLRSMDNENTYPANTSSNQVSYPYKNEYEQLEDGMDGCQIAMMEFVMRGNNQGHLPKFVGITEDGRNVFESEDGLRVFSVSANGRHLQVLTFDEKNYWDNIVIKDIQDNGFLKYLDESVQNRTIKYKGGTIKIKDLNSLDEDMLKELLPQIKAEFKMNLIDNSTTVQYKYYYLTPEVVNTDVNGMPVATSAVGGASAKLSGGGRASINAEFNATPVATGGTGEMFNAKAELSVADAEATATIGTVVRIGNRYFLASGEVSGSAGFGAKAEAKLDTKKRKGEYRIKGLLGAKIGGVLFMDITPPPSTYHSDGHPANNNTGN